MGHKEIMLSNRALDGSSHFLDQGGCAKITKHSHKQSPKGCDAPGLALTTSRLLVEAAKCAPSFHSNFCE